VGRVALQHGTDAEFADTALAGRMVVALADDHVPAVAAAALQVAAAGRPFFHRRDDLEELAADGQDAVLQPEPADPGVDVPHFEVEHGAKVGHHGLDVVGDEGDLAKAKPHAALPFVAGRYRPLNSGWRFSMNARNASRLSSLAPVRRCRSASTAM